MAQFRLSCVFALVAVTVAAPVETVAKPSLSQARSLLSATAVKDLSLFAGGYDSAGLDSAVVDIFDASNGQWTTAALSTGRGIIAASSVSFGGHNQALFAGGKHMGANRTAVVDIFDANTGVWSVSQLSQARSMVSAVTHGQFVYFAGGELAENSSAPSTAECSDVVDIYDVASSTWSVTRLSQPRKKLGAAATGDLVLFGGGFLSGVGSVDTVDILDTVTGKWSVAKLSVPRFRHQAVSVGPLALFISGQGCSWTCATVDVFDVRTKQWSVSNMSQGRYEFSAVVVGDSVVVAGGKQPRPRGINPNLVEVFDLSTMRWRNSTTSMSNPRYFLTGTSSAGTTALFAGGTTLLKNSPAPILASVEEVDPH